jgi:4-hydroxy-tetrahydrodipicolinate synthase
MLTPTIVQGAVGIVSGGAHIFGHEIREIFQAYARGENEKVRKIFINLYRFCKTFGQNGRILPNPIIRPAIELISGIKLGPARSPLSPITNEEYGVMKEALKAAGKI